MSIIMNELKWAENAIKGNHIDGKPYEFLTRIARYYMYNGKNKNEVMTCLDKFIMSCDKPLNISRGGEYIESIVSYAEKRPLYIVDGIKITKPEIEKIQSLEGIQIQRLAFTLLCIAKFSNITNPKNEFWVNTPDNEIMKMANIGTSIKRQSEMFYKLRENGMIKYSSKIDNLSVQVLFVEDGDTEIEVSDFRNVGYQYMNYVHGGYYVCECCGVMCKKNNDSFKPKKYCGDCAIKIRMRKNVESVMRLRSKN